jgi:chemotaxis protein histidine kinase CheA
VSGRGVGLAAVSKVVAELHGRIEIASTAGLGTTWSFHFPLETMAPDPPRGASSSRP